MKSQITKRMLANNKADLLKCMSASEVHFIVYSHIHCPSNRQSIKLESSFFMEGSPTWALFIQLLPTDFIPHNFLIYICTIKIRRSYGHLFREQESTLIPRFDLI